ncbi:MAG TPA: S-adenosylmethionine:tRNA ribosyltransferase-isomerase [Solirubrobacteraceae bacterium]|nr:S-adenosylmethionine:tRNA ribosyltransferase-isomerase [Solirubrobacteraceae bacterium]
MSALAFDLLPALEASEPPEARGLERDEVRLMVTRRSQDALVHTRFRALPDYLAPGDLVVINNSGTLPAAVPALRNDGSSIEVRFSTRAPGSELARDRFVIELRAASGVSPLADGAVEEELQLPGGATVELLAPYAGRGRLWLAGVEGIQDVQRYLNDHGHPIRYGYVRRPWPLSTYQTAYATVPGSAEMPSAGRPFTAELLTRLIAMGVLIAPVTLHAGVSSPEAHEPPYPEEFTVPPSTARLVNHVRAAGQHVIAVGTTVVRALESAAAADGTVKPRRSWTNLVISKSHPVQVVDGLLTGWHEPRASHLQMLEEIGGERLVKRSYEAALTAGYLWHEFGDSHLILP